MFSNEGTTSSIGKKNGICPYCGQMIRAGERLVSCGDCGAVHHEMCWVKNSGCTTEGCHGLPAISITTPSTKSIIGRLFGNSYTTEAPGKLCPYCQSIIEAGQPATVCVRCGMPHHKECYEHNGGCTTYGCVPRVTRPVTSGSIQTSGRLDLTNERFDRHTPSVYEMGVAGGVGGGVLGAGLGALTGVILLDGLLLTSVAAGCLLGMVSGWALGRRVGELENE